MTETAVDISSIRINGRHRKDLGDVDGLARSISRVGLLNPVTVTSDLGLVAGHRRVEAFRALGRESIPVHIVESLDEASVALEAERDENVCRKEMLPEEVAALADALMGVAVEDANERRIAALKQNCAHRSNPPVVTEEKKRDRSGEATFKVAETIGMSGSTYADLHSAYALANDETKPEPERNIGRQALDKMNAQATVKGLAQSGIKSATTEMRRQLKVLREQRAIHELPPPPEPQLNSQRTPSGNDRSREAIQRRRELIREMAGSACTSIQIAERLQIHRETVKRIAKDEGISIPADELLGKTRQRIDSNRVVGQIVESVTGLEMSLGLIDFDQLDRSEIQNWTNSLAESIRLLNRLNKKLKEVVQ